MLLTHEDKQQIMDNMPEIKLSYDNILHKKVFAHYYSVIPKGKKALVWFTYYKMHNLCLVLELNKDNNVSNITSQVYCFDTELSYNTILYGTLVKNQNTTFFTTENILFYKNKDIQTVKFNKKLDYFNDLFKNNIKNTSYLLNNFIITVPIIKTSYIEAIQAIQCVSYPVYGIQLWNGTNYTASGIVKYTIDITEAIFKIKADIDQDIYNLYCYDKGSSEVFYNVAMIPDYKTSVFMNSLFRTIKENNNLDLLEESDDDEEFENTNEDKFVDLTKELFVKCVYMPQFRKWKPVSIIKDAKPKIITKKELYEIEKQKNNRY